MKDLLCFDMQMLDWNYKNHVVGDFQFSGLGYMARNIYGSTFHKVIVYG